MFVNLYGTAPRSQTWVIELMQHIYTCFLFLLPNFIHIYAIIIINRVSGRFIPAWAVFGDKNKYDLVNELELELCWIQHLLLVFF